MRGRSVFEAIAVLAVYVLVIAVALDWAWQLLRPLVPLLIGLAVAVLLTRLVIYHRRNRW